MDFKGNHIPEMTCFVHFFPVFTYNIAINAYLKVISMAKIMVDAGHGGYDNGASFNGRLEKDDNLALALAVGSILANQGMDVVYTRTEDVYQSPSEKARLANASGADYFISIHRNSSTTPNQYSGIQSLIYNEGGIKQEIAEDINENLESLGFPDLGISIRPNLAVLRRTQMPAVLVEAGFINNDFDNQLFDERFDEIAKGIADGILDAVDELNTTENPVYRVQVGLFANYDNAVAQYNRMVGSGYPAEIVSLGNLYAILSGSFLSLQEANRYAASLQGSGFDTAVIQM